MRTRSTSAGTLLPKDTEGETGATCSLTQGLQREATCPRLLDGLSPPDAWGCHETGRQSRGAGAGITDTLGINREHSRRLFMGVEGDQQRERQTCDLPPCPARPCGAEAGGLQCLSGLSYPLVPFNVLIFPVQRPFFLFLSPLSKGLCFSSFVPLLFPLTCISLPLLDQGPCLNRASFLLSIDSQIISGEVLVTIQELAVQFPCRKSKRKQNTQIQRTSTNTSCPGFRQTPTSSPSLLPPGPRDAFSLTGLGGSSGWMGRGSPLGRRNGISAPTAPQLRPSLCSNKYTTTRWRRLQGKETGSCGERKDVHP